MLLSPWVATAAALIIAGQLIRTWAALLNLGRMEGELPPEFADLFTDRNYARSQEYTRAQTRFELLRDWYWTLVILFALETNLLNRLDLAVRELDLFPAATGLVFLAGLFLLLDLLGLPFEIYQIFRLEGRFGMNMTTAGTFIADRIKGYLLTLTLGGALGWAILVLLDMAGGMAWLYCTLAFGAFLLVMQFIGPTFILPLFNTFTPIRDQDLRQDIFTLAWSAAFPLKEVYILDGSRRSAKGNAFFAGIGKSKRIALFDTLTNRLSRSEILAVLAHEMGHFRLRHIHKRFASMLLKAALLFVLLNIFIAFPSITNSLGLKHHSVHVSLVFFALLYSPLALLLGIHGKWKSRQNEYEADAFAAGLCPPEHLINALKRLSRNNLGNLTPHPAYVLLHFSHPPVLERIRELGQKSTGGANDQH